MGAVDVIVEVLEGILTRFADETRRGEMHDGIDGMVREDIRKPPVVANVSFNESRGFLDSGTVAHTQVVEDNHRFASSEEAFDGYTSDVSCAAGNENTHSCCPFLRG